MPWIESHDVLPTHPKTAKLARRLGVSKPAAVGHLHFLWWWCITHRPEGVLHGLDADDIAEACGWDGDSADLIDALFTSGWLDDDGEALVVHDWWEHAGQTIARRDKATQEQRESGRRGAHRRWCVKEQKPIPNCALCASDEGEPKGADAPPNGVPNGVPLGSDGYRNRNRDKNNPKPSNKAKRATQLPDDWQPNPKHVELASEAGLDLDVETVQFRDHHTAKGSTFKDWDAAFRTWLRNAVEFGRGRRPPRKQLDNVVKFAEGGRF